MSNDNHSRKFTEDDLSKGRVIIPYGRSLMALIAAHSLGRKGVEVITCDSIDFTVSSFSKYTIDNFVCTDQHKDEEQFLEDIEAALKKYKPEDDRPYVLMPVYKDTRLIARHKERFEKYAMVATPDFGAISRLNPKSELAQTVRDLDVAAPRTWLPDSREELEELADEMPFPLIIKPYAQAGGRGISKVENEDELLRCWDDNQHNYGQKSLIQEISEGKDYCLTALFDHGDLKASMAYRNVYTFPAESGAGVMRETVDDERFAAIAKDLMGPLEWNGVAEFDFIWNEEPDSTPSLLEVNTRFWGGIFQSVESGIDFPWMLYKLTVLGSVEPAGEPAIGTRTKMPVLWPGLWLYSAMQDVFGNEEKRAEIEEKGREALDKMKSGNLIEGAKDYANYMLEAMGQKKEELSQKAEQVNAVLKMGKSARREVLDTDDPYAAFGVLFIVDSLIRHGHLPEELKL